MKRFKDYIKEMRYGPGDPESKNVIIAKPYAEQDPIGAKIRELETTSEHPKNSPARPDPIGDKIRELDRASTPSK